MVRADASSFVRDRVPDASLAVVHVYFPDPWPKARHQKRRLIAPAFLEEVRRILVPGGRVQVVTDHADYWQQIEETFAAGPLKVVEYIHPGGAGEGEVVGTNFERKYIREGRTFHAIAAVKA
jgi:tRNA (guanine-N7-)-methyltransferase